MNDLDTDYVFCSECCCFVEGQQDERICALCNPGVLEEDTLQELDFDSNLYDRED